VPELCVKRRRGGNTRLAQWCRHGCGRIAGLVLPVVVVSLFTALPLQAETFYVTDELEITVRSGPGTEYKVLATASSGQPLDVQRKDAGWVLVRVERNNKPFEGWVLERYLVRRVPFRVQAAELQEKTAVLGAKLEQAEKGYASCSQEAAQTSRELEQTQAELAKTSQAYTQLQEGCAEYYKTETAYQKTLQELTAMQQQLETTMAENGKLRSSERNKWFATGAIVLLCGLLIGVVIGKQQKKRRSSLY